MTALSTRTPHPPVDECWLRVCPSVAVVQVRGGFARTWLNLDVSRCHGASIATPTLPSARR